MRYLMKLNDELRIGEVSEVSGKQIKAGIYYEKNTEFLNFNGDVIKNVSIGSFVIIRKSYTNIVGKVEGEFIKENSSNDVTDFKGRNINRVISISILGSIKNNKFIHGLNSLPMVGNYVYVATESIVNEIFTNSGENNLLLGNLIGVGDYPFSVNCQNLLCSHIGIFGNTGSGKSNTLAKIYKDTVDSFSKFKKFNNNAKFVFIDFNGEYGNVFDFCDKFNLSTRIPNGDKYPISIEDITDTEFWSIILEATDKTQKPFIERAIKSFKYVNSNPDCIDYDELIDLIYNSSEKYTEVRIYLKELFQFLNLTEAFQNIENELFYHNKQKCFYTIEHGIPQYNPSKEAIYYIAFKDEQNTTIDLSSLNQFDKFAITLYKQYCRELCKAFVTKEHIGPLLARSRNRIDYLDRIFNVTNKDKERNTNIDVISLIGLNVEMRKIVPLIICKKYYNEKKESRKKTISSTLHIIIDEAHNILSTTSIRESEEWKDYRLECFEEIIKEGRKFGTFLTIASQRPSDISDTIISQLHNYFIHRLVNEEDLRKIYRTISFSDKATNEMISILPAGGCVFSGLATNFPILAQITKLDTKHEPTSQNANISKIWKD